jgi:hypothetical protein
LEQKTRVVGVLALESSDDSWSMILEFTGENLVLGAEEVKCFFILLLPHEGIFLCAA